MLEIHALSLSYFTAHLQQRKPFAFVRYGDGEFQSILGNTGRNCDKHEYFPDLREALARTLTKPHGVGSNHGTGRTYLYAIGPKAARGMHAPVNAWIESHAPQVTWHDTEVLLRASLLGELAPLVQGLNQARVMLIGGAHLAQLVHNGALRSVVSRVIVPDVNAWLAHQEILADIRRGLLHGPRVDVILFSAGMLSKVLIWDLFPHWGAQVSLWDTGSLFDMYCGRDSRSYARRMQPARKVELMNLNFGGAQQIEAYND